MATYQDSRYNIALPSGSGGAITLIKTFTASSDSTISFVNGASDVVLDSTYRTYIFKSTIFIEHIFYIIYFTKISN